MIKRSEFGFKEWLEFMPTIPHQFDREKATCSLWYRGIWHNAEHYGITMDSAARGNIEFFCKTTNIPLPWEPDKPDFLHWSRDECEEYIAANIISFTFGYGGIYGDGYLLALGPPFFCNFSIKMDESKLEMYQAAAEYVWDKVNEQEEENVRS